MTVQTPIPAPPPLLDIQDNGMGDVVLACWIIESAAARGLQVQVNPRNWHDLPRLLGMPAAAVTRRNGPSATGSHEIGLKYEYHAVHDNLAEGTRPATRFALWSESLGLTGPKRPELPAVRPRYCEDLVDRDWAAEQWSKFGAEPIAPRVVVFSDSARSLRRWPASHFRALVALLRADGWHVAAMASRRDAVETLGCRFWYGFGIGRVAAMVAQADLVIAGDTGPAHLAGTIGTPTLALCGPTIGRVVFGHDANVRALHAGPGAAPPCAPCHFSTAMGYGESCRTQGCGALSALDPALVHRAARSRMAEALDGAGAAASASHRLPV